MCEPLTIASIGATLAAGGLGAYASYKQGQAAKDAAYRTAATQDAAAASAVARGDVAAGRTLQRGSQVEGAARAAFGASGVQADVGSAGDVGKQIKLVSDLDAIMIQNNAAYQAYALHLGAANTRQQGDYAERSGTLNAIGGIIGTVGKVAGVAGKSWIESSAMGGDPHGFGSDDTRYVEE